ncbi:hypothetical protein ACFE04_002944 [Oxalis oulophora]
MSSPIFFGDRSSGPIVGASELAAPTSPPLLVVKLSLTSSSPRLVPLDSTRYHCSLLMLYSFNIHSLSMNKKMVGVVCIFGKGTVYILQVSTAASYKMDDENKYILIKERALEQPQDTPILRGYNWRTVELCPHWNYARPAYTLDEVEERTKELRAAVAASRYTRYHFDLICFFSSALLQPLSGLTRKE